jgi:hypothetical protein
MMVSVMHVDDRRELEELDQRLRVLLPENYQEWETIEPKPMKSAGLKFGPDGKVAWDQIWERFCDRDGRRPPRKGRAARAQITGRHRCGAGSLRRSRRRDLQGHHAGESRLPAQASGSQVG